jgi:threonylcarbamoyladenosine tRNA methylthiotransferase MtaB
VINTCTVTANAEKKLREIVKAAKKRNPSAKVVAIGCFAQRDPAKAAQIPGVDVVLGMKEKFRLNELLPAIEKGNIKGIYSEGETVSPDFLPAYSFGDRTRSFLKIQDGCDYPCTYCIIPEARGKGRNPSVEDIVNQAVEIASRGVKEIVLTGVNIGTFTDNSHGRTRKFIDLIQALDRVEGIRRYRISSIEPNLLTDEIIEFVLKSSKKFLPHFHIPLQSGSNEILARMKRRYRRELYAGKVRKIKSARPDAAIGVDVIVGFPGETRDRFDETYLFLKDLDVSYFHVFSYSNRPGTEASKMPGQVPKKEIVERSRLLRELSARKYWKFVNEQLHTVREVLFERCDKNGFIGGFTDNYIKVVHPSDESLKNEIKKVILDEIYEDFVRVKLTENET